MRRLRRFLSLSAADRVLLVRALGWVALARAALWFVPFTRLRVAADRLRASSLRRGTDPGRVAWAVQTATRAVPRATCLAQALAADAMLRRTGRAPTLRIGVAKEGASLEAHAWLELDGAVLVGDHDLHRYTPLERRPGPD
jgi:hypothetical protein